MVFEGVISGRTFLLIPPDCTNSKQIIIIISGLHHRIA